MGDTSNFQHPLLLGSFRNWMKVLRTNEVDRRFSTRALSVSLVSLLTGPLRLYERLHYRRAIAATPIAAPPIFILGHWRSGTTHLHYLLSKDPALGYMSTFQAIAPELLFVGDRTLKPAFAPWLPSVRPMDDMSFSIDVPQEDEVAVANMTPYSFYHQWSFPRMAARYLEQYGMFEGVPDAVVNEWKSVYMEVLRKTTLETGNRRLVLKNPINTARVKLLLELFPDAKFVHIYRNPYDVFLSTLRLYEKALPATQLQIVSQAEIEANIVHVYEGVMRRFLAQRSLIPAGNLVEIRFEQLEEQPLTQLRRLYEALQLPGFDAAQPAFAAYAASLAGYRKNQYSLSPEVIETVNRHFGFALDEWDYPRRAAQGCPSCHAAWDPNQSPNRGSVCQVTPSAVDVCSSGRTTRSWTTQSSNQPAFQPASRPKRPRW